MKSQLFEELFLNHERQLIRYCLHLTKNKMEDAEDLAQETFIKFFEKFFVEGEGVSSFSQKNQIGKYLKKIADSVRNGWYRKDPKLNHTESVDESYEAFLLEASNTNLDRKIDFEKYRRDCYLKLNQFERSLVFAHFLDGESQREIAEKFKISRDTVRHRIDAEINKLQSN